MMDLSAILGSASNTDEASNKSNSTATFGKQSGDEGATPDIAESSGRPSRIPEEAGSPRVVATPVIALEDEDPNVDTNAGSSSGARSSSQRPGSSTLARLSRSTSRRRDSLVQKDRDYSVKGKMEKSRSPSSRDIASSKRGSSRGAVVHTNGGPSGRHEDPDKILEEMIAAHESVSRETKSVAVSSPNHDEVSHDQRAPVIGRTSRGGLIRDTTMQIADVTVDDTIPIGPTSVGLESAGVCTGCESLRNKVEFDRRTWDAEKASLIQRAEAKYAESQTVWEASTAELNNRLDLALRQAQHFNQLYQGLERRFEEVEADLNGQLGEVRDRFYDAAHELQTTRDQLKEQTRLSDERTIELSQRANAVDELTRQLERARAEFNDSATERYDLRGQVSALENSSSLLDESLKSNVLKLREAELQLELLQEGRDENTVDMAKQLAESQAVLGSLQARITQLTNDNESLSMQKTLCETRLEQQGEGDKTRLHELETRRREESNKSNLVLKERDVELANRNHEISALKTELESLRVERRTKAEGIINLVRTEQSKTTELTQDLKSLGDRCQSLLDHNKTLSDAFGAEKAKWVETEEMLRGEVTMLEGQLIELQDAMNRSSGGPVIVELSSKHETLGSQDPGVSAIKQTMNTKRVTQESHDSDVKAKGHPAGSHDPGGSAHAHSRGDDVPVTRGEVSQMMDKSFEKFAKVIIDKISVRSRNRRQSDDHEDEEEEEASNDEPSPPPSDDDDESEGGGGGGPPHGGGGPPDDDEPPDDRHDGDGHRGRRMARGRSTSPRPRFRVHEAETVKVPSDFPTAASLGHWKVQVGKNLVAASGRWDEEEMSWFMEIEREYSTFESLANSGDDRFRSLDLKLAAALGPVIRKATNSLTLSVSLKEGMAAERNRVLKGRQIVWMMYQHFQTNPNMGIVYNITDLSNLQWLGDPSMQSFLYAWYVMVNGMQSTIEESTLRDLLLTKMEKSVALQYDLFYYYRLPDNDPNKSYQYLIESMERYIQRASQQKNRRDFNGKHLEHILKCSSHALPGVAKEHGDLSKEEKKKKKLAEQKKKQKQKEQKEREASAAPGPPKGGGKGDKKAISSQGVPFKEICYWFNHGTCKKGKECSFKHTKLNDKEKGKLTKPGSRANSQVPPKGGGKGQKGKQTPSGWCHQHLRPGGCPFGENCTFPHLDQSVVDEIKRASAKAKAKGKGRSPSQSKSQQ